MRRLIILVILVSLTSCCKFKLWWWQKDCGECDHNKNSNVVRVAMDEDQYQATCEISKIIIDYQDELKRDLEMYLIHSYAEPDEYGQWHIWLDFNTQEILDVAGARRMIVRTVEGFLDRLNSHPWLYIRTGRFTPMSLYVSVELTSYYGKFIDPLIVGRMELEGGFLTCYYAHDALNPRSIIFHQHFEPYASAVCFVRHEDELAKAKEQGKIPTVKDFRIIRNRRDKLLGYPETYP